MAVSSPNVRYALGAGEACHAAASRWVLPTPNPPSRYRPGAVRSASRRPRPHRRRGAAEAASTSETSSSISARARAWLGCSGLGTKVSKRTAPNRRGGRKRSASSAAPRAGARSTSRPGGDTAGQTTWALLPLDGSGWLAGDVERHPVDARHLVDQPARQAFEDVVGKPRPVGGHGVVAGDGPDDDRVGVGALVTHDPDGAD